MFRAESRYTIIALDWQIYTAADGRQLMAAIPVTGATPRPAPDSRLRWGTGWFGLLSYDDYAILDKAKLRAEDVSAEDEAGMLAYIHRSLVIDHHKGSWQQVGASAGEPGLKPAVRFDAETFWPWRQYVTQPSSGSGSGACAGLTLVPSSGSDEDYLAAVAAVRADIESGRFYQLNLLRYFQAADATSLDPLTRRFLQFYEPYSLWCSWPSATSRHNAGIDRELVSFSPERFVAVEPCLCSDSSPTLVAEPIKGTMGRGADAAEDEALKAALCQSAKDQAELHMIVDLLRHDMWPLCVPHSITVRHPHRLRTFKRVHHLVATIAGTLKPRLSLAELWAALLPAGSITGTPKREVMTAIRQLEGRGRGLFMGVAFHFCPASGALDSSVLIRTVQRSGKKVRYAAGSGLTIRSDPAAELAEISQKCRVVTDLLA